MRLIAPVTTHIQCGYTRVINDMPSAELKLATGDPLTRQIVVPATYMRISDGQRRPEIYRTKEASEDCGAGGSITYRMEGAQATLLDDMLIGHHELGGTGLDTRWVMQYILARQTTARWQLGTCDYVAYYQYNFEDVSLLEALMSLGEVLTEPYVFDFDTTTSPWTVSLRRLSSQSLCSVMVGRNARAISRSVDGRIVTRLVGRGYGEGDNQMTIAAENGGLDYLDADTIGKWGVRVGIHADRRQTDAATLKARMAAILEAGKNPRVSYTVRAIDLSQMTGERADRFEEGDMLTVLDEALGEAVRARITQIERPDIDGDPGDIELTLDTAVRDTAEELNEVLDKIGVQELYSQGATNLYSMQISDSADEDHPLEMQYYVPGNVLRINACILRWQMEPYRSYAKLARSGGGSTQTSTAGGGSTQTSSAGGGATVSIPARTAAADIASGSPMVDGASNVNTGYAKASDGSNMGSTGGASGTTGSGGPTATGTARNGDGTMTSTGSAGSHTHNASTTHRHTVNDTYTSYNSPGATDSAGSHSHSMSHWHAMDAHTHSIGSHSHDMTHRHEFSHYHLVNVAVTIPSMTFELSAHTHSVNTPSHSHSVTIPEHTHELEHGIYNAGRGELAKILVDGEEVPAGEWAETDEIDVAKYMRKDSDGRVTRGTWHKVEFVPDALTRITANLFFQVFIQSRGAGDY